MARKRTRSPRRSTAPSPWLRDWQDALAVWPAIQRLDIISVGDVWGHAFHTTARHELLHVLEGRAEIRFRGRLFHVAAGDTFVIPEGTPHRDIRQADADYRVLYVFFEWPEGARLLRRLKGEVLTRLPQAAKAHVHAMMNELADEYQGKDQVAVERMHLLLLEILLALGRYAQPASPPASNARRAAAERQRRRIAEAACAYLKAHFAEEISLEALAESHGVSPFNLSRWFSQEFGTSLFAMLARIRMDRARELLSAGHSVKETAAAVGYANGNYFAKVFRRVTGRSPSEYLAAR